MILFNVNWIQTGRHSLNYPPYFLTISERPGKTCKKSCLFTFDGAGCCGTKIKIINWHLCVGSLLSCKIICVQGSKDLPTFHLWWSSTKVICWTAQPLLILFCDHHNHINNNSNHRNKNHNKNYNNHRHNIVQETEVTIYYFYSASTVGLDVLAKDNGQIWPESVRVGRN